MKSEEEIKAKIKDINQDYRNHKQRMLMQAGLGNFHTAMKNQNDAIICDEQMKLLKWVLNEET